ncbi:glycosyltransferase family 4 protein [Novilysobacter arseniciresistens]|uniref:glycosyltransferase family 4 protein n=1 Tax=Novilysobacter arseniciresistens TaxID=1385522 RepID=UPI0009DC9F27|nr:glycosyltransferase family 1 protein [Lysobacter arseniciresistens]
MHIVLDLQACQSPESGRRGIGRYSLALAKAMTTSSRGHRISVLLNSAMVESVEYIRAQFSGIIPPEQIVLWHGLAPTGAVDPANRFRSRASEVLRSHALKALQPDIVHVASLFEGVADNVVSSISGRDPYRTVTTLYDLIPLAHEDVYLADKRIRDWYMEKVGHLQRADQLLGISRFSCDEARELLGVPEDRLTDISGAADEIFAPLEGAEYFRSALAAKYGLRRNYVMYAGGFDSRKNIAALIRAFAKLPPETRNSHQLAIVGGAPTPERSALERVVDEVGLSVEDVVFTGFVPDSDLVKLYNLCALYAFPSLQEGFGLPALEAMSSGAVVIGSATSSLPEVIGFDDALFDPRDVDSIAHKMQVALTDTGFRRRFLEHAELQSLKFSWVESANRAFDGIELALDRVSIARGAPRRESARQRRRRTALLPAPRSDSPRRLPRVKVFADSDCTGIAANYPIASLGKHRHKFDRIVAEVSDDGYGAKVLEASAVEAADIVVLDSTLGNALEHLARRDRKLVIELVLRQGGYAALKRALGNGLDSSVLSELVPPSALDLMGQAQVISIGDAGAKGCDGWRDNVDSVISAVLGDPLADQATEGELGCIAAAIAASLGRGSAGDRWLVDISILGLHDAGTGIQRVVRHVLDELMDVPPEGVRIEPVMLGDDGVVRYARSYCQRRYFPDEQLPGDEAVEFSPSDVYVGLDLAAHLVPPHVDVFRRLRAIGVRQYFVVYDLLPLLRPECFDANLLPIFRSWYEAVAEVADGVACISRSVADEFEAWLHQFRPNRLRPLHVGWFHLGADVGASGPASRKTSVASPELSALGERPTFLMVGTIEPRKGHAQVLEAFEQLWADGQEINLLIVGRPGWMVDELLARLRQHPQRNEKLFWFENADDDLLVSSYARASALVMASEGEGFGLPLIEAAHQGIPLIVRDLPVFREIAGENAHYFSGYVPDDLAVSLGRWIELHVAGKAPQSTGMGWKTWAEATQQLVEVVRGRRWVHSWLPGPTHRFGAYDYRFQSQVGQLARGRMASTGEPGVLLYGPYVTMPAGRYSMALHGRGAGSGWMDVCSEAGTSIHARMGLELSHLEDGADCVLARMEFELFHDVRDLELRVGLDQRAWMEIAHVEIHRELARGPATQQRLKADLSTSAGP